MKISTFLIVLVFITCVANLGLSSQAFAHPNQDKLAIQLLLHKWAIGMQSGKRASLEEALADDFRTSDGQSRSQFLESDVFDQISQVSFDYAVYNETDAGLHVSSVVAFTNVVPLTYSLELRKDVTGWKINYITSSIPSPDLKRKLLPGSFPEQFDTLPVSITLQDADAGVPVYARVNIIDEKGEYWPPQGHQKFISTAFPGTGGDVKAGQRTYAYVKPDFVVELVPGTYTIYAIKGMEYTPTSQTFTVTKGQNNKITLLLKRWINMQAQGWYSGDTHVHSIDDHNAVLEAQAEELNIVNILAMKIGQRIMDINRVTGAASPISRPDHIVYYNVELRHGFLGHTIVHPIKEPVYPLSWGDGITEGVAGGYDYPTMAHQADKAHAQGGIVTWAHLALGQGEVAVDVALGKIDSVDLFRMGSAFGGEGPFAGAIDYWYKFLNTGFRLPASAGTDKMTNNMVLGSMRTYAHLGDEKLTYRTWADAISQGKSIITTGPMISFSANGQEIGSVLTLKAGDDLFLEAEVNAPHDRFQWDRFEIVQNGKVIASHNTLDKKDVEKLSVRLMVDKSSWFAARVYDSKGIAMLESGDNQAPPMAHTSPIYVEIPGNKLWSDEDAAFLAAECDKAIEWARNKARYHTESQRKEVIALYQKAKAIYDGAALP